MARREAASGIGGSPMIFLRSCGALLKKSIDFEPKFLLHREMKTRLIALSLGLILAAGALYAADPFEARGNKNEFEVKADTWHRQEYQGRL